MLITGPGGSNLYYKGLLDKLGVTANVYRVGTYKAAVEPFIRNDMSPAAKENAQALDQAQLESWKVGVKQARPRANVDLFLVQHERGSRRPRAATWRRLRSPTDLSTRSEVDANMEERLAELGGADKKRPRRFRAHQARVLCLGRG